MFNTCWVPKPDDALPRWRMRHCVLKFVVSVLQYVVDAQRTAVNGRYEDGQQAISYGKFPCDPFHPQT
jgi:hypothetical protein